MASFFKWLTESLTKLLSFLVSIPGLILTAITSFITIIKSIFDFLSSFSDFSFILDPLDSIISEFAAYVDQSEWFQLFSYVLSLDVAFSFFSALLSAFVGLLTFIFATVIVALFALFVQFIVIKLICKIIRLICPLFNA